MKPIRSRCLPSGWYPEDSEEIMVFLESWSKTRSDSSSSVAVVAPHAGWSFSGELACSVVGTLDASSDVVAVIGGHLPSKDAILMAPQKGCETPLGIVEFDSAVGEGLRAQLDIEDDLSADNTVEIQLPLVKYFFPKAKALYLRVSPTAIAQELGEVLYALSIERGLRMSVIGSTDLTHYGHAYGFAPAGRGRKAIDWVRNKNDAEFLNYLKKMDVRGLLSHAISRRSACSAGAAAAAVAFASSAGVKQGVLIGYEMSCDSDISDTFVGYGGMTYAL